MVEAPKKKKISARMIRAFFNGQVIGLLGGAGLYIMTTGVNQLAGSNVMNPIAMLLLAYGVANAAALGIELSKDLEE